MLMPLPESKEAFFERLREAGGGGSADGCPHRSAGRTVAAL